jgi:hypothetical protein
MGMLVMSTAMSKRRIRAALLPKTKVYNPEVHLTSLISLGKPKCGEAYSKGGGWEGGSMCGGKRGIGNSAPPVESRCIK